MKTLYTKFIIGLISFPNKCKFKKLSINIRAIKITGPCFSRVFLKEAYRTPDKNENKTLEPSRGGIGIKLNTNSTKFKTVKYTKKIISMLVLASKTGTNNLKATKEITATNKLERGPAMATIAGPNLGYFKLYGLKGTGFAHPKAAPIVTNINKGTMIVPTKSM